jgi:periplasmic protein CpxP/Spy
MNKTRFLIFSVVALILLNIAIVVFFMTQKNAPNSHGPRKIIIEHLHFDQKQVDDYENLIQKHQQDIRQKDIELTNARQVIYQQLLNDNFTKKDSLINQVGRLQIEVEQIHLAHFRDIKQLCKPEQLADFNGIVGDLATYFPSMSENKKGKK